MKIPQLDRYDMYKFMVYAILKNHFTLLSAEEIKSIGCQIITRNVKFFMKHNMGKLKPDSYFLSKQRPVKSHGDNMCVIDYVWDQVKGKRGFTNYDYDKLKNELFRTAYG